MKAKIPTLILLLIVIGLMTLLLSSCMTSDKATGYLSAHRETAASYCAAQFPVKVTSESKVVVDSATYIETVDNLTHFSDSVLNVAAQKNDSIDKLKALVKDLGDRGMLSAATVDVLQAQIDGIHKTDINALRQKTTTQIVYQVKPCKDSIIIRTVENTAKSEAAMLRGDRLQGEKDDMTGKRDWWRKWCLITWSIIAAYIALRYFASKLAIIGKFIK